MDEDRGHGVLFYVGEITFVLLMAVIAFWLIPLGVAALPYIF